MAESDRFELKSSSTDDDNVTVISISSSKSSLLQLSERIQMNRIRTCSFVHHRKISRFFKQIKQYATYQDVIIVINYLSIEKTEWLISQMHSYRQVKCIFTVVASETTDDEHLRSMNKTVDVFHDHASMLNRMGQCLDQFKKENTDDGSFIIFNRPQKALKDLREQLGSFIWINTIRSVLITLPYNSDEAKNDMLNASRHFFHKNSRRLAEIDRFAHEYFGSDAIRWYTKESFLYQIINKALRSEDPYVLYLYRYYIFDLSQQLALNRPNTSNSMSLYRGATIHRDEVRKLTIGSLVSVNGFFSSTRNIRVAQTFLGISDTDEATISKSQDDERQFVLFEILVDWNSSPDLVVADASIRSVNKDEEEMLFDLGTTFEIQTIEYDTTKCLWNIQLTYSSEKAELVKEYDKYINERLKEFDPRILFGRLLSTHLAEYQHAKEYFHRLLGQIDSDSVKCANVYYELGRTYRFQGEYDIAIQYFNSALEIQKRNLPKLNFEYAMTLAGIATVYLERCQAKEALIALEQADQYFKEYPFDYNHETIFQANRMSYAYYLTGEYDKGLELLNVALDAYERKIPCDHPTHAQAWHNIGLIKHARGEYDEAKKAFQEALRMRKARLSPDHPYIARTHYQMSLLYEEIGEMALAIQHAEVALKIRRHSLPVNHIELKESHVLIERFRHSSISSIS